MGRKAQRTPETGVITYRLATGNRKAADKGMHRNEIGRSFRMESLTVLRYATILGVITVMCFILTTLEGMQERGIITAFALSCFSYLIGFFTADLLEGIRTAFREAEEKRKCD